MNRLFITLNSALVSVIFALSANARAEEACSCDPDSFSQPVSLLEISSQSGQPLKLVFPTADISIKNDLAFLCTQSPSSLSEAKLWMPSMGHGSTPTQLIAASNTCTRIQRIRFLMAGDWEIRMTFSNQDKAVFAFDVLQ